MCAEEQRRLAATKQRGQPFSPAVLPTLAPCRQTCHHGLERQKYFQSCPLILWLDLWSTYSFKEKNELLWCLYMVLGVCLARGYEGKEAWRARADKLKSKCPWIVFISGNYFSFKTNSMSLPSAPYLLILFKAPTSHPSHPPHSLSERQTFSASWIWCYAVTPTTVLPSVPLGTVTSPKVSACLIRKPVLSCYDLICCAHRW